MLPAQNSLALEELGWSSFQDLAVAVCEDVFDLPVMTFSPTKDKGVDGFVEPLRGRRKGSNGIVIQAKHSSSYATLSRAAVSREISKAKELSKTAKIDLYVLVTNMKLSVGVRAELIQALSGSSIEKAIIIGRENIIRRVRKSASLRAMVPRLYGIGDLSQILDERRLLQARAILESAKEDLDKFVITESYRKSVDAVRNHRILILLGEPAVGKSTIARCLSIAAIDEFDAYPVILERLDDIVDHWNPNDAKRLFWIDDTFGVTQRDDAQVEAFNRVIPILSTAMRAGSRFVFTSRTYIWRLAKPFLKLQSVPKYDEARVEIDVRRFTDLERAQIVYNHVRRGDQDRAWKTRFKPLLPFVSRHAEFKPEVARRLGSTAFTRNLLPVQSSIDAFITNPGAFLETTISGLDDASRAALAAVLMAGGALESPVREDDLSSVCDFFGVMPSSVRQRLSALEGAFFRLETEEDQNLWRFKHPTIGEAVASVASENAEMLDVYLKGAKLNRILSEVTCAGREIKGAILKISKSRTPALISRMREANPSDRIILQFLAYRTTADFRKTYFLSPVSVGDSALGSWDLTNRFIMDLLILLEKDGLLSPDVKPAFLKRWRRAFIYEADTDCLCDSAKAFVGPEEFRETADLAWEALLEETGVIVGHWEGELDADTDPDDTLHGVISFADELADHLDDRDRDSLVELVADFVHERAAEIKNEREEEAEEDHDESSDWGGDDRAFQSRPSVRTAGSPALSVDPVVGLFSDVDN